MLHMDHSTEPVHHGLPTFRPGGHRVDLQASLLWQRAVANGLLRRVTASYPIVTFLIAIRRNRSMFRRNIVCLSLTPF